MKKSNRILLGGVTLLLTACGTHYEVAKVSRSRILIDSRYDGRNDAAVLQMIKPYTNEVSAQMSPVVGKAARYLKAGRPEGQLNNLLGDMLMWAAGEFGEKPDFAVYNVGGIRASLAKGDITVGNVIDVAPFDNKICFLTMTGADVKLLFSQIAMRGGEGVSKEVKLVIGQNGGVKSLLINGKTVEDTQSYRVATIDYLADGNDEMTAFKKGTNRVLPSAEKDNARNIIIRYFKHLTQQGKEVDAQKDGRITIE